MEKQYVFFLVIGLMYLAIGIPLALSWVKPNPFFGFKAKILCADAELWYPVNRRAGQMLAISGLLVLVATFLLPRLPGLSSNHATLIGSLTILAGLLTTASLTKRLLRTLYYDKYESGKKSQ